MASYEFDIHTHSIASGHGTCATMTDMAKAANAAGLKMLGISDHGPKTLGGGRISYFRSLAFAQPKRLGVRMLYGAEVNILDQEGKLDLDDEILESLDYVIASMHRPIFKSGTADENTRAYIKTMENPNVNIIGHCDDEKFPVDYFALFRGLLDSSSGITSWGRYYTKSVTLYNAEGEKETVSLVAAADESQMTEYFTFRTRQGHKAIAFDDSSVILTEKTAEKLGLSVGDSFEVETADGGRRSLTLTGITENYVFTRLYLSQAQLKTLNGGALPAWNAVYGQTDCPTDAARASLSSAILACNYVSSVSFIEDTTQMFDGLIGCLNYVVMLVIVCAAALAAVVLYNLISVNLGERKKELATIKVLGFYDKEVYRYIFREIDLLSLIGSLVGLVVGIPLHQFIIRTVEMDQMMFIRSIAPRSFVFSVALTMLFNFVVCLLMRRHVRQISMVESMKAPE